MSWLWIYITLMEWVGIVLVVKALGDDTKRFSFRKTGVYFCVYVVYSVAFDYFSLPPMFSVTSYYCCSHTFGGHTESRLYGILIEWFWR